MPEKACPLVIRLAGGRRQVLAFIHPHAGRQFVKGSIEPGETPGQAAARELAEESGIRLGAAPIPLGAFMIGAQRWHFFDCPASNLPDRWQHRTEDGGGLLFDFFGHPPDEAAGREWDAIFHEAYTVIRRILGAD